MKKITLYFLAVFLLGFSYTGIAQTLNQNAGWPNANWTVTGTFNSDPAAFEADPTTTSNFAFDDDDAGNPSADNIAAESPEIDLTAAFNAGETWLSVSVDYYYNKLTSAESLTLEYWDADTSTWVIWDSLDGTDTIVQDDFCTGTRVSYTSSVLNIEGFTSTQQSEFKYRLYFNDAGGWVWGFCFDAPTIASATPPDCPDPNSLTAIPINTTDVTLEWVEFGSATIWNIEIVDVTAGGTQTMTPTYSGVSNPYVVTMLVPGNEYEFYVQADCEGSGVSNWVGPVSWSQPNIGDTCEAAIVITSLPYSTSDDTSNYGDDYSGAPGDETSCGTNSGYLGGDDVVYEYTATSDTSINVSMTPGDTWSGIFAYTDCADIGTACVAGIANSSANERNFDLVVSNGTTYYFVISTWPTPQSTTYTLNITENTCIDATVTYTVVNDCDNSGGFKIIVNVIDIGSSSSIDINDGQGTITQTIGVPATLTYGPYVNGTEVTISITDNDDSNCDQDSGPLTQEVCPPPNDLCEDSIPLICGTPITGQTTDGATGGTVTSCIGTIGNEIWYQLTGSDVDVVLTVTASVEEAQVEVYESTDGTCAGITPGECFAAGGSGENPVEVSFTAIAGSEYYIRVGNWINGDPGVVFDIEAVCTPIQPAPDCAMEPITPANGETDLPAFDLITLSWTAPATGPTPTSYDIYVGTESDGSDQALFTNTTDTFTTGTVGSYNTTIYWTVVPKNATTPATGCPLWSFTTGSPPPPPANDDCPDATILTPGGAYSDNPLDGTVESATADSVPASCGVTGPGVWYSVVVPADGNITFETGPDIATGTTSFDSVIEAFSGSCGALTSLGCDDDGADTGLFSLLELTGLTPGSTIYLRVWAYNGGSFAPFSVSAYNATLSVDDFETQSLFSYYPNPVTNNLTLNAQKDIQNVVVYNMLGQQVMRTAPNTVNSEVDMSTLNTGSYFVQVTIDNATETIRIIKN
jgi:hypothetical protein